MPQTLRKTYETKLETGELEPDPGQLAAVEELERLRRDLASQKSNKGWRRFFSSAPLPPKGIYLYGDVGRGKTMLMDLFAAALPADIAWKRVHFHQFMLSVHDYLHKERQEKGQEAAFLNYARDVAGEVRLLCFDEFHVTDIADAMILGRLFEALLKEGVTLIATSNWPPDRLYEGGLQRERFLPFIDLIKDHLEIIEVTGETDYRLQCLTDTGVYFSPLGRPAAKQADQLFTQLTGGAQPYTEELTVKSRTLHVPSVAKGVARFSFSQLCEKPLGAEDYLRIAHSYHTVFVEDIPRMGYDRRNEAKRFMTLIDALYDTKTKLVAIAAEPPDALYTGDDYAFEFQRTASRLIEMQSETYLQA